MASWCVRRERERQGEKKKKIDILSSSFHLRPSSLPPPSLFSKCRVRILISSLWKEERKKKKRQKGIEQGNMGNDTFSDFFSSPSPHLHCRMSLVTTSRLSAGNNFGSLSFSHFSSSHSKFEDIRFLLYPRHDCFFFPPFLFFISATRPELPDFLLPSRLGCQADFNTRCQH